MAKPDVATLVHCLVASGSSPFSTPLLNTYNPKTLAIRPRTLAILVSISSSCRISSALAPFVVDDGSIVTADSGANLDVLTLSVWQGSIVVLKADIELTGDFVCVEARHFSTIPGDSSMAT